MHAAPLKCDAPVATASAWVGISSPAFGSENAGALLRHAIWTPSTGRRPNGAQQGHLIKTGEHYHEDVRCRRHLLADLEKLEEVIELPVDVAAHSHWCLHRLDIALFHQQILHLHPPKGGHHDLSEQ
jgi:hypothetical protein